MGLVSSLDPLDLLFGSVIGAAERKEGTRQVEFGNPFSPRQYLQVFCLNEADVSRMEIQIMMASVEVKR